MVYRSVKDVTAEPHRWAVWRQITGTRSLDTSGQRSDSDRMDAVKVNAQRITYRTAGTGPPFVLLHGAYEDSRVWERQLEDLSGEFTVVAWDAPGCGESDDLMEGAGTLGEILAGFLAALGLAGGTQRPHVLGLSFGSVVALDLLKKHPGIPATLILASAYAGWAGSLPPEEVERRPTRRILRTSPRSCQRLPFPRSRWRFGSGG